MAEYCKNWVYLWYVYCSNLFGKMRREANFGNGVAKILRKSRREEREMMWPERKMNLGIHILFYSSKSVAVAFFFFLLQFRWLNCHNWVFFFLILHFWQNTRDTIFFTKTFINYWYNEWLLINKKMMLLVGLDKN